MFANLVTLTLYYLRFGSFVTLSILLVSIMVSVIYKHIDQRTSAPRLAGLPPPSHPDLRPPSNEVPPEELYGEGLESESEPESENEHLGDGHGPPLLPIPSPPLPVETPTARPTPTHTPRIRVVGAKKARSIARRDQRRAYHEFLHSQAAERARAQAAMAEEEEERLFEEKRRRALIEEEIASKKEAARRARVEEEKREEERERGDVEVLKRKVGGSGAWRVEVLAGKRGEDWGRDVLRREALVGKIGGGGDVGVITGEGWYVRLGARELDMLFREMERRGRMQWGEIVEVLESAVGK